MICPWPTVGSLTEGLLSIGITWKLHLETIRKNNIGACVQRTTERPEAVCQMLFFPKNLHGKSKPLTSLTREKEGIFNW